MSTNPLNFSEDPKAETFEAAETRAEKQRHPSHRQISDLIEARKLAEPTDEGKKFFNSVPARAPEIHSRSPRGPARFRASGVYTDHLGVHNP